MAIFIGCTGLPAGTGARACLEESFCVIPSRHQSFEVTAAFCNASSTLDHAGAVRQVD